VGKTTMDEIITAQVRMLRSQSNLKKIKTKKEKKGKDQKQ